MPSSGADAKQEKRLSQTKAALYLVGTIIGVIALAGGAVFALGKLSAAVAVVCTSLLLVFILRKPVAFLERKGLKRGWGTLISFIVLILCLVVLGIAIVPAVSEQLSAFLTQLPSLIRRATAWVNGLIDGYQDLLNDTRSQALLESLSSYFTSWAGSWATRSASYIVDWTGRFSTGLVVAFMSIVAAWWILIDMPRITREIGILVSPKWSDDFHAIVSICAHTADGYIRGTFISAVINGVLSGVIFLIVGVPYPVLLGLLAGLARFVPVVGPIAAGAIAALLALFVSPTLCLGAIIISFVSCQITDGLIIPRVMQATVELHPALVIIALMAGNDLGGALGMIIAVPVAAAIKGIYVYYFERRTGRKLVSPDGAFFAGRGSIEDEIDPAIDAKGSVSPGRMERKAEEVKEQIVSTVRRSDPPSGNDG